MIKQNGLFKETLIYTIGSFGSKVLSFLLIPLYSFFLTKKDLGEYDLFITTVTLFVPLISLQISDAAYRWLVSDPERKQKKLLSQVITNALVIFLSTFVVFIIIFYLCSYNNFFDYSGYFILTLFFSSLLPFLQSVLRGLGKTKTFALNGIFISFLIILFNVLFVVLFEQKVEGVLKANIIANAIGCLVLAIKLDCVQNFRFAYFDIKISKQMLLYALPLVPNMISWWLISSANKFIILEYLGVEENGIYAISSRFPSILVMLNTVLVMPIQDMYLKGGFEEQYFKKIVKQFIVIEFSLILLLSVAAPLYTKILVDKTFYSAWQFMPMLYLGVGFNTVAALIGLVYQKNKKTFKITTTTLIGGVVSILLSYFLVNVNGLNGISTSFFVGYFITFLLRFFDLKYFENKDKFQIDLKGIFLFVLFFIGVIYLLQNLGLYYQIILTLSVIVVSILVNYRILITKFYRK